MTRREKCAGVLLAIQGVEIVEEFLLFELGRCGFRLLVVSYVGRYKNKLGLTHS